MGGKRDPHYMNLRNGNMLSLAGKANKSYPEDDPRFNAATMGNRIFKTLPKKASTKKPKGFGFAPGGLQRAAGKKLRNSKTMGYGVAKGRGYGKARRGVS